MMIVKTKNIHISKIAGRFKDPQIPTRSGIVFASVMRLMTTPDEYAIDSPKTLLFHLFRLLPIFHRVIFMFFMIFSRSGRSDWCLQSGKQDL